MDWDVVIVFGSITAIIVVVSLLRHKERMGLISKGINPYIMSGMPAYTIGGKALFLGLVAVAVGLALLISAVFVMHLVEDMLIGSLVCIFGGAALLAYWKLTAKERKEVRRIREERLAKLNVSIPAAGNEQAASERTVEAEAEEFQS